MGQLGALPDLSGDEWRLGGFPERAGWWTGDFPRSWLVSMEGFVPAQLRCDLCAPRTAGGGRSGHQGTLQAWAGDWNDKGPREPCISTSRSRPWHVGHTEDPLMGLGPRTAWREVGRLPVPQGHFPPQPRHRWKGVWFPEKHNFPTKIVGVPGPSVPKDPWQRGVEPQGGAGGDCLGERGTAEAKELGKGRPGRGSQVGSLSEEGTSHLRGGGGGAGEQGLPRKGREGGQSPEQEGGL